MVSVLALPAKARAPYHHLPTLIRTQSLDTPMLASLRPYLSDKSGLILSAKARMRGRSLLLGLLPLAALAAAAEKGIEEVEVGFNGWGTASSLRGASAGDATAEVAAIVAEAIGVPYIAGGDKRSEWVPPPDAKPNERSVIQNIVYAAGPTETVFPICQAINVWQWLPLACPGIWVSGQGRVNITVSSFRLKSDQLAQHRCVDLSITCPLYSSLRLGFIPHSLLGCHHTSPRMTHPPVSL
jgi:hypothetical protein